MLPSGARRSVGPKLLGYGSLYNHSFEPNARYDDLGSQVKLYTAIRAIEAGREITINYNGEPTDRTPVGFEVIEASEQVGANGSTRRKR